MSIEPLPAELRAMISAEPKTALPPDVESRLLGRLDASIATAFAAPPAAAPKTPPLGTLKGAMLFLAGGLTGALITAAVLNREPPAVLVPPSAAPVAAPFVAPPVAPPVSPVETPVEAPREDKPVAVVKKTVPNAIDAGLALSETAGTSALEQERRLLEPARTALARGLTPQALELLEKHERQFTNGVLAEERDALWVQALSVAGQGEAAQARAKRFRAAYPDSLFLPVVERALMSDAGN